MDRSVRAANMNALPKLLTSECSPPARWCRILLLAAGFVLVHPFASAQAEVIVIGSSTSAFKSGTVLDDKSQFDVPAGTRVRVMLPSGRTKEIEGPAKVKVASLTEGEQRNEGLWNDVKKLVTTQKSASESQVGAVRSVAPKPPGSTDTRAAKPSPPPTPVQFSWRHVPFERDGDVCVEKGAALELLRAAPGRPIEVNVVNMQSNARAPASFAVGSATTAWPAPVGTEVGRYTVVMPDGAKHDIRLRPITPLPAADDTLRLLHSQRCLVQVEAWLRGQMTASR